MKKNEKMGKMKIFENLKIFKWEFLIPAPQILAGIKIFYSGINISNLSDCEYLWPAGGRIL